MTEVILHLSIDPQKPNLSRLFHFVLNSSVLIKFILKDMLICVSLYSTMYYVLSAILINIFSLISYLSKG